MSTVSGSSGFWGCTPKPLPNESWKTIMPEYRLLLFVKNWWSRWLSFILLPALRTSKDCPWHLLPKWIILWTDIDIPSFESCSSSFYFTLSGERKDYVCITRYRLIELLWLQDLDLLNQLGGGSLVEPAHFQKTMKALCDWADYHSVPFISGRPEPIGTWSAAGATVWEEAPNYFEANTPRYRNFR